ncbi:MAG: diacylglycerol/polyprenol kinase family protein [Anaerolineae bacterium]
MSQVDLLGLILSYTFAFGILGLMEFAHRRLRWPQDLTRKIIHIGAGTWVFGIVVIFDHWWWGIVPSASFVVLNYVFHRAGTFRSMDPVGSGLGTVYFALSVTVVLALFWSQGRPGMAVAALMPMTWGDALASLLGRRWGSRIFSVGASTRTLEGSMAMYAVSWLATLGAILIFALAPDAQAARIAVVVAALATLAEAVSPHGTDNLTVPAVSAVAVGLLLAS